jgi:DNA replication protein DnaC
LLFNIAEKREFKPTIITTNYTGDELKKIYNNKIIDRLMPTNPAQVLNFENVPSYRKN